MDFKHVLEGEVISTSEYLWTIIRFCLSHLIKEVNRHVLEFCAKCFILATRGERVDFGGLDRKLKADSLSSVCEFGGKE